MNIFSLLLSVVISGRCDNGECISQSLLCDGEDDCGDKSDEIFCNVTCKEFRCKNGSKCIAFKYVFHRRMCNWYMQWQLNVRF